MFEQVKRIARTLGIEVIEQKAEDEKGRPVDVLVIHHSPYNLYGLQRGGIFEMALPLDIDPKDAALLARQPADIQERLLAILRREMMEGRTGFEIRFDETKKPPELRRIAVVQRLVVVDDSPTSIQRFADGIQEMTVVAVRAADVMGRAFGDMRTAQTAPDTYHAGMYA